MMDSTTITLFDNILKGVGRHQKSGKKKGGMKVHTVMKYHVGVPMVVRPSPIAARYAEVVTPCADASPCAAT